MRENLVKRALTIISSIIVAIESDAYKVVENVIVFICSLSSGFGSSAM